MYSHVFLMLVEAPRPAAAARRERGTTAEAPQARRGGGGNYDTVGLTIGLVVIIGSYCDNCHYDYYCSQYCHC